MALARQSADPERDTTGLSHHSPARNPVPFGTPIRGSHFGSDPNAASQVDSSIEPTIESTG
jgi:hypothetical protein